MLTGGLHGNYRYVLETENGCTRTVYEGEKPSYKPELFIPVPVRKGVVTS
jgi:hypothetical protein